MIKKIKKSSKMMGKRKNPKDTDYQSNDDMYSPTMDMEISAENIKQTLGRSDDFIIKECKIGNQKQITINICFIDGLVNQDLISSFIVKPLLGDLYTVNLIEQLSQQNILHVIKGSVLSALSVKEVHTFDKTIKAILLGDVVLVVEGYTVALVVDAKGGKIRGIEEPTTETTVRGPREGFTETLRINTALLRRRIRNPHLTFETMAIGEQTQTNVVVAYIEGIANTEIIKEVKQRLNKIDTDAILESGYIEQYIEDAPHSLFSTVGNSEKPDKVAAKMLEGRVAILCDGTPVVLTVPFLLIESFQVADDYYSKPYFSSMMRMLRIISFIITLIAPAVYVALETFHQEMIPTVLLITMAQAREGIPFPAFVETVLMLMLFEILRESGLRLPRAIGQTVSIAGTLIIGQAAVEAGIISTPMVIIGSLTGITAFIVPPLMDASVFFRFMLVILSSIFGFYGIIVGLINMLAYICSIRSFGVSYFAPLAPRFLGGMKDTLIRVPLWIMQSRPKALKSPNITRQAKDLKPKPDENKKGEEES